MGDLQDHKTLIGELLSDSQSEPHDPKAVYRTKPVALFERAAADIQRLEGERDQWKAEYERRDKDAFDNACRALTSEAERDEAREGLREIAETEAGDWGHPVNAWMYCLRKARSILSRQPKDHPTQQRTAAVSGGGEVERLRAALRQIVLFSRCNDSGNYPGIHRLATEALSPEAPTSDDGGAS